MRVDFRISLIFISEANLGRLKWDEAILPSQILTLERRRILRLIDGLYKLNPELSKTVETVAVQLNAAQDGDLIEVPEIEQFDVPLEEARAAFTDDDKNAIEALYGIWPAPGSEDTELGVLMEPEVDHGEAEVYARVQA